MTGERPRPKSPMLTGSNEHKSPWHACISQSSPRRGAWRHPELLFGSQRLVPRCSAPTCTTRYLTEPQPSKIHVNTPIRPQLT